MLMTEFGNNPLSGFKGEDFKEKLTTDDNDRHQGMTKTHMAF